MSNCIEYYSDYCLNYSLGCYYTVFNSVAWLNIHIIKSVGLIIIHGIILHNAIGLTCRYFVAKFLGYELKTYKIEALKIGMQNS